MIAVLVVLVVLFLSARGVAGFYTDYLWFDSVGFGTTWRGLLWARFAPAAVFTIGFFVMMLTSLTLADRLAPRTRGLGPEDEMLARYQQSVGPYSGRIRLAITAFFALIAGGSVSGEWEHWILFTHAQSFGIEDPQFHQDVGFYVFRLPFLTFVFGWLFAALIIILIVTAIAHYLNGGIRLQSPFQRVTPQVKAHLSVILALMALVKTAQYYLARFELDFSTRGVVQGASKTDVAAQLPALNLLMVISVVAAALFVWNIWRRGWVLPIIAVGLWAFVSLVIGTIFPAVYQKFGVDPNAQTKEQPYIARNIAATRNAFQLDDVTVRAFDYRQNLTQQSIADNSVTVDNARLWDPTIILRDYQIVQGLQTFYKFGDADTDRYTVDGSLRQVMISARELNLEDLPSQSWVNRHIVYTHGYGAVVSPANSADGDGLPEYALKDIPPQGSIQLDRPELYFGERLDGFSLVDAEQDEFNFPRRGGRDARTRYSGKGGVDLSSLARRAAFALKYSDVNLLISGQISDKTRIIYERDVRARVEKAAPFLQFDADPYPVIADGRLLWMMDGYTTTNEYPYAQRFHGAGGLDHSFNYVRNSVKATVDAYDGTIRMYVADPKDPLIKAWRAAFPKLFTDYSKMPKAVQEHVRYPQDLFKAQTDVYRKYHVTNPSTFFQGTSFWDVSPDPGSGPITLSTVEGQTGTPSSTTAPQSASSTENRIEPIYVLMRLPGETKVQFLLLRPFVPVSRGNALRNLRAFMVAKAEPNAPNRLQSFQTSAGNNVPGPPQVNSTINNTDAISERYTLLGSRGSQVWQGSLQLLPVDDSLLYIRPIYVISNSGAQPNFRFVVVFYAGSAKIAPTIDGALEQFGLVPPGTAGETPETPTTPENPENPESPTTPESPPTPGGATVDALLQQATQAYSAAEQARKNGDLGEYQKQVTRVGELLQQAAAAMGASTPSSTSSTTSTTRGRGDAQAAGVRR
jgi:uncharacterized membrane protein (UPF0182 family)